MTASGSSPNATPPARQGALRLALPVIVLAVILAVVTLLLVGGSSKPALPGSVGSGRTAAFEGSTLEPPPNAPPLRTLRNYDGASFDLAAERGKAVFVTFLYAHCPDVCPLIASNLHNAYAAMSPTQRGHTAIVTVSVDPHGDSAASVAAFMTQHQLAGEARYLIGSAGQLAPVWEAWKVGSQRDTSNPQRVNHSALIYGIGASGRILTIYPANFAPAQIVHDVRPLLSQ